MRNGLSPRSWPPQGVLQLEQPGLDMRARQHRRIPGWVVRPGAAREAADLGIDVGPHEEGGWSSGAARCGWRRGGCSR